MILLTPAYGRMRADSDSHAALPMPDFSADADTDSVDNRQQLGELLQSISEAIGPDSLGQAAPMADTTGSSTVPSRDTGRPRLDSSMMARTAIYNPEDLNGLDNVYGRVGASMAIARSPSHHTRHNSVNSIL